MNGSYPTTVHRWRLLPHLVVDVAGFEHRPRLVLPVLGFETTLDSLLAVAQYLGIGSIHSKCLFVGCRRLLNTYVPSNIDGHFELLVQTSSRNRASLRASSTPHESRWRSASGGRG